MSKTISNDLRHRVAAFVDKGYSCRAAARYFGVSESFAIKLIQRRKAIGDIKPARQGRPPAKWEACAYRALEYADLHRYLGSPWSLTCRYKWVTFCLRISALGVEQVKRHLHLDALDMYAVRQGQPHSHG